MGSKDLLFDATNLIEEIEKQNKNKKVNLNVNFSKLIEIKDWANLTESIQRWSVREVVSLSPVSANALVKTEPAWNSLGQGTHHLLSHRNSYKTRGADPGCDGWIGSE